MQKHQLLKNRFFTASTQIITSNLNLVNDYFLHNVQVNGGGIVNETNVRAFLNDDKNTIVINDFFSYLTGNTTFEEFREIFYNDTKLSGLFNQYYQTSILSGIQSSTAIINQELTGTSSTTVFNNNFNFDGNSPTKHLDFIPLEIHNASRASTSISQLETFTSEESYYVPILLNQTIQETSRNIFEVCAQKILSGFTSVNFNQGFSSSSDSFFSSFTFNNFFSSSTNILSSTTVNTQLIQCFVDLNSTSNPNENWSSDILSVSFGSSSYSGTEGQTIVVDVFLNKPSVLGIESVNVAVNHITTNSDDFNSFTPSTKLSWSGGEQFKQIKFDIASDFILEGAEKFRLVFSNTSSVIVSGISTSDVFIGDTTILRDIQISQIFTLPTSIFTSGFSLKEGMSGSVIISLNAPSIFGVEEVDLIITPITALSTSFSPNSNIHLSWNIGEQDKIINFNTINDNILYNSTTTFLIELSNPKKSLLNSTGLTTSIISILDDAPDVQFSRFKFKNLYIQKGNSSVSELRYIYSDNNSTDYSRLIKFGVRTTDSINASTGPNSKQPEGLFGTAYYFFGLNENGGVLGDVRLKITNLGNFPIIYNSQRINPNQSFSATVTSNDFNLDLPANDGFISGALSLLYSADTLTTARYNFEFQVDYSEFNFKIKNESNITATNKKLNIGTFNVNCFAGLSNAQLSTNSYILATTYTNIITGRFYDAFFHTYSCPSFNSFGGNVSEKVKIQGIVFISDISTTNYNNFEFIPGGTFGNTTCSEVSDISVFTGQKWTSVPFLITP